MVKSNTLYLAIIVSFAGAYFIAAVAPEKTIIGFLCMAGTSLFLWRIGRGDD